MNVEDLKRELEATLRALAAERAMPPADIQVSRHSLPAEGDLRVGDQVVISFAPRRRTQTPPADIDNPDGFEPIDVQGEPVSVTLLRDRR